MLSDTRYSANGTNEYLDSQIPVTQLYGDMQAANRDFNKPPKYLSDHPRIIMWAGEIKMRHLPAVYSLSVMGVRVRVVSVMGVRVGVANS